MQIFFRGALQNNIVDKEFLPADSSVGLTVIVTSKDGVNVFTSITEVHSLFPNDFGDSIALESDIHGTGMTMDVVRDSVQLVIIIDPAADPDYRSVYAIPSNTNGSESS